MMALKPVNATYEEAAALSFGALEAFNALRKANMQKGQKVLIVGAGGNIGTYAVQLANHYGAEVTGVDKAGKLEILRSIGADYVIDYTQEDFTKCGQVFDIIFDTIGKSPFEKSLRLLTDNGVYVNANPGLLGSIRMRSAAKNRRKRIIPWSAEYTNENLLAVKALVEEGIIRAVIDRRYPMEQIVEAHRYVESGQKKGNVIITVSA